MHVQPWKKVKILCGCDLWYSAWKLVKLLRNHCCSCVQICDELHTQGLEILFSLYFANVLVLRKELLKLLYMLYYFSVHS